MKAYLNQVGHDSEVPSKPTSVMHVMTAVGSHGMFSRNQRRSPRPNYLIQPQSPRLRYLAAYFGSTWRSSLDKYLCCSHSLSTFTSMQHTTLRQDCNLGTCLWYFGDSLTGIGWPRPHLSASAQDISWDPMEFKLSCGRW